MAAKCIAAVGVLALASVGTAQTQVIYDSQGFENFATGGLAGQFGWEGFVDSGSLGVMPQVVTSAGGNQVEGTKAIRLEVPDIQPAQSGMQIPVADLIAQGFTKITVTYDIYQQSSLWASNLWWYWYDNGYPTYGLMWDAAVAAHTECWALGFDGTYPRPTGVFDHWETVVQTWDFTTNTAVATYNGITIGPVTISGITTLTGWAIYVGHDEATGTGPEVDWIDNFVITGVKPCYANCDGSTVAPTLNANDFQCFLNKFAAQDSYANCDGSTVAPILNANDFQCFLNKFAAGCS